MDEKTRKRRQALGYDLEEGDASLETEHTSKSIPGWVFGYSGLASFIIGIIGMLSEIHSEEVKILMLYFSLSFFLAPALLIYPIFRVLTGEGKKELAVILSALFGFYVQSSVKDKIK